MTAFTSRRLRLRRGPRREDERGFVAIFTVMCFAAFMFGCAALAVDIGRFYLEAQRLQRAADAGALGGVSYLPQDMTNATATANAITARNGYTNGTNDVTVTTGTGSKKSQLSVTVCSVTPTIFAGIMGYKSDTICRTAVADYTGPAPLGSPCNTFANEPSAGGGTSSPTPAGSALATSGRFSNCSSNPQMWANVEGPEVDKVQGDRFQTEDCGQATGVTSDGKVDGCDTSDNNTDYDQNGYFYLVHVEPTAVNHTIDLQLFDPGFVYQTADCSALDTDWGTSSASNSPNYYVNDAKTRYNTTSATTSTNTYGSVTGPGTCAGDSLPGYASSAIPADSALVTTSFDLRQQTDTLNPAGAVVQTDTSNSPCIRQYTGSISSKSVTQNRKTTTTASGPLVSELTNNSTYASTYNDGLAKEFHNWVSFCKFTPTRSGDYYLQVRTNVKAAGTALDSNGIAYSGNTNVLASSGNTDTGIGSNSFSIRAVTQSGDENKVSVSSYDKMPIFMNASGATAQFNLIRVLPGAAGKSISFSYFDVGDAATDSTGSIQVKMPADSTLATSTSTFYSSQTTAKQFPNGCLAIGGKAATTQTYTNCTAPFDGPKSSPSTPGSNNGKVETISIPIPSDYTCNYASLGGCWYQVIVTFKNASAVSDTTTWTADIVGQPVRLIQ